jgi:hypothetical protein
MADYPRRFHCILANFIGGRCLIDSHGHHTVTGIQGDDPRYIYSLSKKWFEFQAVVVV